MTSVDKLLAASFPVRENDATENADLVTVRAAVNSAIESAPPRRRRHRGPRPPRARSERHLRAPGRGRIVSWLAVSAGVAVSVAVVIVALSLHHSVPARSAVGGAGAPTIGQVVPRVPKALSEVLAADGSVLGYIDSGAERTVLAQRGIPSIVREATVAAEDPGFWARPTVTSDPSERPTLTMRLVRSLYLPSTPLGHGQWATEARFARELSAVRSKPWILDEYLNDVTYGTLDGKTMSGVEAASQMLFDKSVSQLDLAQVALLAGLPDAPELNSPLRAPAAALRRRTEVLRAMVAAGSITPAAAASAERSGLQVHPDAAYPASKDPAIVAYVAQQLRAQIPAGVIAAGGLTIRTTIEPRDQLEALASLRAHEGSARDPVAALASINPTNGHIVAIADNRPQAFNYAANAAREPGSAFTVFALMALIHDQDGDPAKTFYVSHFLAPGWWAAHPTYSVHNDEGSYQGVISVARALTTADNTVFAQLGLDLGPNKIDAIAHAMGITASLSDAPSVPLSGLGVLVSPLQMADAYGTLADGGVHIPATIISSVTLPGGATTRVRTARSTRVLTAGEASEATKLLQPVIAHGTGTAANFGCPAAGKTGSTSDFSDAWFIGYTPQLATSVWLGYPSHRPMTDGFGGTLAAPIWRDYMQAVSPSRCGTRTLPAAPWSGHAYHGAHTVPKPY
jgi:penicillin-binding protein 1A